MNKTFSSKFKGLRISEQARDLLLEIGVLIVGFFMSGVKFFFDTYPFALALCASSRRHAPFALAGSALGAVLMLDAPIPYLITLLALLALRLLGSVWLGDDGERVLELGKRPHPSFMSRLFCERASVRVGIGALCALGLSIYRVVGGGYSYFDIFVLIFSVVLSSILTYSFCNLFEKSDTGSHALGACAVLFVLVWAIRGWEIFGLDLSIIISYGATLYASKYLSGARSVALGALLGLCHGVAFAPVFAICALISSLLWSFSYYLSIISALVMSIGYGVFASGYEAIVYLLPELLLSSLVMYPLTRFEILPTPVALKEERTGGGEELVLSARATKLQEALKDATLSLKEISKTLLELSARSKNPDREFWRDTCLEICETHCYQCPKRSICWERDVITTRDNLARLGDGAFGEKTLTAESVDERFLHRCPNIDKIIDELNTLKRDFEASRLKYDKLEISADDYEMSSRLLEGICKSIDLSPKGNPVLSDKATRACKRIGLAFDSLQVFGEDRLEIIIANIDTGASKCSLEEVRLALEEALASPLCTPVIEAQYGASVMICRSKRQYSVLCASKRVSMLDGQEAGDAITIFEGIQDKQYMLLCDGMGSGKDAFEASSLCVELLKRLLSAISDKELCLCMLNSFLRAKSLECSSSVDLLEIDLLSAQSVLVKSGAAPTFVKRGENVFRLHSKTAPIGIMRSLDAERIDFSLRDGDFVIMISDGIASDEKDSKYIVDFLASVEIVPDGEGESISRASTESVPSATSTPSTPTSESDPLWSLLNVEPEVKNPPRRICISDLPDAIIALARAKNSQMRDDMCVGVLAVKCCENEDK